MGNDGVMIRGHEGNKQETIRTSPRFTTTQINVIDRFIGSYGRTRSEVIKTIVIMWMTKNGQLQDSDSK
ncbi:MAG: hypothetical protein QXU18_08395 [Thermoplasmatales archaeon]